MFRRSFAVLMLCVGAVLSAAAVAYGDTGGIIEGPQSGEPASAENGWQAGTCTEDPVAGKCSPVTDNLFFKTAAGHPQVGFTQYIVKHGATVLDPNFGPLQVPEGEVRSLKVDLPAGLTVNSQAITEQCSLAEFLHSPAQGVFEPECKDGTKVGREELTLALTAPFPLNPAEPMVDFPAGFQLAPSAATGTIIPVFNLTPAPGEPARFGFVVAKKEPVILTTEVSWEGDYHESFRIDLPKAPAPGPGEPPLEPLKSRLVNLGRSGDGTYITNPTTCFAPGEDLFNYATLLRADSYEESDEETAAFPNGYARFVAPLPPGVQQEGCANVPFDPGLDIDAGTAKVDSPAPVTVETTLPFVSGGETISQSHLRNAQISLPAGMGINPSGAKGLLACTDAQFGQSGTREPVACPAGSKIGSVEIETPPLPAGSLKGDVFIGEQLSRDPSSGKEFRIFVDAEAPQFGISVRLVGETKADPKTGRLTAEFHETPQVPFTSVKLHFDGTRSVLTSPPTCAAATTTSSMEPWSTPASTKTPSSQFALTTDPGGGNCPLTLAERRFAPAYAAVSDNASAGQFSPLRVHIGRPDGQQEVKLVDAVLPRGLTGKLAGIPYCPEAAIAAAEQAAGKAEQAKPSCPDASSVGSAMTASGTGADPAQLPGRVYLAGPYKGSPLSFVAVTPAVQGPFDLGTVVVRIALGVDPITAQVHPVSDVIPDVFGGVKLDLRSIDFNIDRNGFMLNPTNCEAGATQGTLKGGGGDPTNVAAFSSYAFNAPYQPSGCSSLGFRPRLRVQLFGRTTRAQNPRLRAVLQTRPGDANIARAALTLPPTLFLDQDHIGTVCTNPKLAAHQCPAASVYGSVEAISPLLEKPLTGAVYLVPSPHELPDLVADLQGQVEIQLHGVISSSKAGGLRTVFDAVPDVPVTKLVLNMRGGKKSLLVNSANTCKRKQRAVLSFAGQNGKTATNRRFPVDIAGCAKQRRHQKHKKHHPHRH